MRTLLSFLSKKILHFIAIAYLFNTRNLDSENVYRCDMNVKRNIAAIVVAALSFILFLGCGEELYDIAKNADRGFNELFALADRGGELVLLRATQSDVREYAVMGGNDVFWSAGVFVRVSGDGTAWVVYPDSGTFSWLIYRSDGTDYSNWIKMGKEFEGSGSVSAAIAARGRMYVYYVGSLDPGLWEFNYSTENFIYDIAVGSATSLFHSRDDDMLYITVDTSMTEIYRWDFASLTIDLYNSSASSQLNSFFSAKYGSEFVIGYKDELIVDHNGGTNGFPDQLVPSFYLDNYTIHSYAFVYEGLFAASTNVTTSTADIIRFDEVSGFFEVFRNISGEQNIDIKLLYLGGSMLAVGIRGSSEANGLHLYDYKSDELKNLSGYDIYDISVRQ